MNAEAYQGVQEALTAPTPHPAPRPPRFPPTEAQNALSAVVVPSKRAASPVQSYDKDGRRYNSKKWKPFPSGPATSAAEQEESENKNTSTKDLIISRVPRSTWTDELDSILLQSVDFARGLEQDWITVMARLGVFEQDQVLKRYVELSELHHYLKAARFFGTEHHRDDLVGPLPNPDSAPWGNKEEIALLKASRKCKDAPSRLRVEMGNGRSLRCLTSRLKEIDPDGWLAALDGKLEQTEKRVPGKATWRRIGKEMRAEYQGCPYTAIEVKARWDRVYGLKGVVAAAPRRASVDSSSHPSTPPEASITPSSIAKAPTPSAPSAAPTTRYSPSTTARASSPCPQPKPPFPVQTGPWSDQENNLLYQLLDNGLPITPSSVHKKLRQRIKSNLGHQRTTKSVLARLRVAVYHDHFLPATATYSHLPQDGDYIGPKPSPDMIAWSAEEDAELLRLWQLPLQHQETSSGDRIAHVQTLFGSGRSRAGMMDRLSKLGAIAAKETPMDLDPLPASAPPHPPTPGLFDFAAFFVSTPFPNLQKSNGDFDVGRRLLEG